MKNLLDEPPNLLTVAIRAGNGEAIGVSLAPALRKIRSGRPVDRNLLEPTSVVAVVGDGSPCLWYARPASILDSNVVPQLD
jgi:hypothetical protein